MASNHGTPRSFAWHLGVLAAALVLPALIIIGVLAMRFAQAERLRIEGEAKAQARMLAAALDREHLSIVTTLQGLATSPNLFGGVWADDAGASFRRQLLVVHRQQGIHVSLRTPDGRIVVSTREMPRGQALVAPDHVRTIDDLVRRDGRPMMSDVFMGPITGRPAVQIVVPVTGDPAPQRVLGASLSLGDLRDILERFDGVPGWAAAAIDRSNRIAARFPAHEAFAGEAMAPGVPLDTGSDHGLVYGSDVDGAPSLIAYHRSSDTGWYAMVSHPSASVNAALNRSLGLLGVAGLLLGGVAFALTQGVFARLGQAVGAIRAQSEVLVGGATALLAPSGVKEIDALAESITQAVHRQRSSDLELQRRASELSRAQRLTRLGSYEIDLTEDGYRVRRSPEYLALHGLPPEAAEESRDDWIARVHPEDRARAEGGLLRAIAEGAREFENEYRIVRPSDGELRWIKVLTEIVRDPQGRATSVFGTHRDITEQKRAETERDENSRLLQEVTALVPDVIYIFDLGERRNIFVNRRVEAALGYSPDEILALSNQAIVALLHPEDRARMDAHLAALSRLGPGEVREIEYRFRNRDGVWRWFLSRDVPYRFDADGGVRQVLGTALDFTEHKEHEEQVKALLREVTHRSNNLLGVVQSIVGQTALTSPEDFVERFRSRIQALALNQRLLVNSDWRGVELKELVEGQLAPFHAPQEKRVAVQGPSIALTSAAAQAIGMALHELAANAASFGSLSGRHGRVDVVWRIEDGDGEGPRRLVMHWTETGGPAVRAPRRKGFGSTVMADMVERSLGGRVSLDYAASGLAWRLDCPLSAVSADG
jgi:PAS domain S-box-containing protein